MPQKYISAHTLQVYTCLSFLMFLLGSWWDWTTGNIRSSTVIRTKQHKMTTNKHTLYAEAYLGTDGLVGASILSGGLLLLLLLGRLAMVGRPLGSGLAGALVVGRMGLLGPLGFGGGGSGMLSWSMGGGSGVCIVLAVMSVMIPKASRQLWYIRRISSRLCCSPALSSINWSCTMQSP